MSIRDSGALVVRPVQGYDPDLQRLLHEALLAAEVSVRALDLGPENVDTLLDLLEAGWIPLVVKGTQLLATD